MSKQHPTILKRKYFGHSPQPSSSNTEARWVRITRGLWQASGDYQNDVRTLRRCQRGDHEVGQWEEVGWHRANMTCPFVPCREPKRWHGETDRESPTTRCKLEDLHCEDEGEICDPEAWLFQYERRIGGGTQCEEESIRGGLGRAQETGERREIFGHRHGEDRRGNPRCQWTTLGPGRLGDAGSGRDTDHKPSEEGTEGRRPEEVSDLRKEATGATSQSTFGRCVIISLQTKQLQIYVYHKYTTMITMFEGTSLQTKHQFSMILYCSTERMGNPPIQQVVRTFKDGYITLQNKPFHPLYRPFAAHCSLFRGVDLAR